MSNARGGAQRSNDRNTRYATHLNPVRACVEAAGPQARAFEHGMGLASTPFFHSHDNIVSIVSLEREVEWSTCVTCASGSTKPHAVQLIESLDDIRNTIAALDEPRSTIALVDGFAAQRLFVLEALMKRQVGYIVEHDAETFGGADVVNRRRLARNHSYSCWQYYTVMPESALFLAPGVQLSLTGSCVIF